QNKARAIQDLQARLEQLEREAREAEAGEQRASQVRTMDPSDRSRTYNWPENRITDHRIGYKANTYDSVLDGDMGSLIAALHAQERAERIESAGELHMSHQATCGEALRIAAERLRAAGIDSADWDARMLLAHVLGVGHMDIPLGAQATDIEEFDGLIS